MPIVISAQVGVSMVSVVEKERAEKGRRLRNNVCSGLTC